jgi:hypothetical protein
MSEVDLFERFRSGVRCIGDDVVFSDMGIIRLQRPRYGGHSLSIVHEAHLNLGASSLPLNVILARFKLGTPTCTESGITTECRLLSFANAPVENIKATMNRMVGY